MLRHCLIFVTITNLALVCILEYRLLSSTAATTSSNEDFVCLGQICVWPVIENNLIRMYTEETTHYLLDNSSNTDREWKLLYPGNGIVRLGNGRDAYVPSMFHQLRCLDILRLAVVQSQSGDVPSGEEESAIELHCLGYLRQIVLCNADLHVYRVGGAPRDYICRDWEAAYTELRRNQEKYN